MRELKKTEIERLKILYKKIENLQANKTELEEYEMILNKAGFTKEKIKSVMIENGFNSYEEYIIGIENAKTADQKRIVSSIIMAFFVGLAFVVFAWVIKGVIKTVKG